MANRRRTSVGKRDTPKAKASIGSKKVALRSDEKPNPKYTLEIAFKVAKAGRVCPVCKKKVIHAIYQRHFEDCKLPTPAEDGGDDDIIFCGIVQPKEPQQIRQSQIKGEQESFTSKPNNGGRTPSRSPTTSNRSSSIYESERLADQLIIDQIDGLPLMEVYDLCLHHLEKFLGQHQSLSSSQTMQWSQQKSGSNKENLISQTQPNELEEAISFSQQLHEKLEEKPLEDHRSAEYALELVWKILQRVLLCPEHADSPERSFNFWGSSLRIVLKFLSLPIMAQKLFVFLLRRRWGWHFARDTQIRYTSISGDHSQHFTQLCTFGLMQAGTNSDTIQLKDALHLLKRPDFLSLCKEFKINQTQRSVMIDQFLKLGRQMTITKERRSHFVLKSIRQRVGEFFRIEPGVLKLFIAFFTVYSPTQMDTSQLLGTQPQVTGELISNLLYILLEQRNGNLSFPSLIGNTDYSLIGVLGTYEELMKYIDAKQLEMRIVGLLNHHPSVEKKQEALDCAKEAKEALINEYFSGETSRMPFYLQMPAFLRKFTAPWVFCRCIFTGGIEVAQQLKQYELAVEGLNFLLGREELHNFCMSSRGKWYERLALNTNHHLKDPERSAHYCMAGMRDPLVREADKLILQNRLVKMNVPLEHGIVKIQLNEPEKIQIHGTTLAKGLGDGNQVNHFYIPTTQRGQFNKCRVEELALNHFLTKEGFTHGYHTEGRIWHALFRLYFNDIIFTADVPNTWLSHVQDDPLDLNYPDFYANRKVLIDQRLQELVHSTNDLLSHHFYERVKANATANSRIMWHDFGGVDYLIRFLRCCPVPMLRDLFKRFCMDYRGNRSGFPDLTVWNEQTTTLAVVEVKGPNDSLSTKQQLWLHFFRSHGIRAVVCHVVAKNDRALD